MQGFYCNAFNIDETTLKVIKGVLTTPDKMKIEGEVIQSPCGGLLLDGTVFKVDKKTKAITKKETLLVRKTIEPYCGGIKLDASAFEVDKKGIVSLTKSA